MFKYNDKTTRTMSDVFIVNFEHISHLLLVFLLLTLSKNILAELMVLKVLIKKVKNKSIPACANTYLQSLL